MKSRIFWLAWMCVVATARGVDAPSNERAPVPKPLAPVADMKTLIEKAPRQHPRLFVRRGDVAAQRRKFAEDPLLTKAFERIVRVADGLENEAPIKRELTGRRWLSVSRACQDRVLHLAFAYLFTGKKTYVQRAQKEMLAAVSFTDWNPSHFLDVAEMTSALAVGYDWLYDALDPAARESIRNAIIEKGLQPSFKNTGWVAATHNWNQVCHGGLVLGALAVMEDEPALAEKVLERAIKNLPKAMSQYAPNGAYPEGPAYWKYGTTFNVMLISALESALGTDCALSRMPGFMETALYYLQTSGPTGLYFNYSDCGGGGGVSPAMYWFASRSKNPWLLWREQEALSAQLKDSGKSARMIGGQFPLLLLWSPLLRNITSPTILNWKGYGVTPVAVHRTGWKNNDEVFVGLKAGSPATNHAHMDIGSFVMDADGVRWAVDLGSQDYHSLESKDVKLWNSAQNSQRWDVFRLGNSSHNTLVVDGKKQIASAHASITGFSSKGPMPHTLIDMSKVYDGQLAAVTRGIGLRQDRSVVVRDELTTLDRKTSIRWGMVTKGKPEINGRQVILRQGDKVMCMRILAPDDASFEQFETEHPPQAYDAPNPGTCMMGFRTEVAPKTRASIIVLLSPGEPKQSQAEVRPLDQW